jgi:hypothetical protein
MSEEYMLDIERELEARGDYYSDLADKFQNEIFLEEKKNEEI